MSTKVKFVMGLLLVLLLLVPSAVGRAKGPPQLVRISVPGRDGYIESGGSSVPPGLSMGQFENFNQEVEPPEIVFPPVIITRYYDTRSHVPWDQVLYYPDPAGGQGYVYYVMIFNGSSPYDGRWYRATTEGEAALSDLLTSKGITLETPASAGRAAFPTLPAIVLLIGLLGTGGVVLKKRVEHL
jgi:hypothetical protein